ncbi:MAG TPA: ABC transporter permease [Stellaceae bacterium]|nr:ABC transporter permease [Stellaceae bacterium]
MESPLRSILAPLSVFVALGVAWELAIRIARLPPLILPGPGDVLAAMRDDAAALLAGAWATLSEIVIASLLAIAAGFATALAMSMSATARRVIFPYMLMTQVMPKVALAPILVAWFGTGFEARLVLAFLIAYFPMVINTMTGLVATGEPMVRYAQSLAASEWQLLFKVRLPAAMPAIMGGVKITTAVAVIGIVVGEFVASDNGLGKVIIDSVADLDTALTIAATLAIALLGLAILGLLELVDRRVIYWKAGR